MIAPIRQTGGGDGSSTAPLTSARRAIAQVFFERDAERPSVRPLPAWLAWLFVGWVALAAVVYVCRFGNWKISPY